MNQTFNTLREKYPEFIYERFWFEWETSNLVWHAEYKCGKHQFHPKISFPQIDQARWQSLPEEILHNLGFQLGLIELMSYWKATCSPQITLSCGTLNAEQVAWWQDLFWQGLGEFRYRNQIELGTATSFVTFHSTQPAATPLNLDLPLQNRIAVPLGGGKDSVVTLELLHAASKPIWMWAVNAIPATHRIAALNPQLEFVNIQRQLDPQLLELNQQGFLNGHVPISANFAFISSFVAVAYDSSQTAVSNEQSANENTLVWNNEDINHQYSKSYQFEKKFRDYSQRYLINSAEYFSFLRPLHEIQIGKLFSSMHQYHQAFRSCNVGQKTDSWCSKCGKCLFAYLMLAPFIDEIQLHQTIFDHNLLEDPDLVSIALSLIHPDLSKPWDCVGTRLESQVACAVLISRTLAKNAKLPLVLESIKDQLDPQILTSAEEQLQKLVADWNNEHFIPQDLASLLKAKM